jgi:hypothetical protein
MKKKRYHVVWEEATRYEGYVVAHNEEEAINEGLDDVLNHDHYQLEPVDHYTLVLRAFEIEDVDLEGGDE